MALNRDEVVDAACVILDEFGLTDLTMRRLGDALGVRAGALYYHVPNKQTLLAWVSDRILADVRPRQGDWRSALSGWAWNLREVLLAHRDSADLVASARAMGISEVDAVSAPTAALSAAGLSHPDADAAASALLHFVLGHVAEEQARADWERFGQPDPDRGPTATEQTFTVGVQLLVDGVKARFSPL